MPKSCFVLAAPTSRRWHAPGIILRSCVEDGASNKSAKSSLRPWMSSSSPMCTPRPQRSFRSISGAGRDVVLVSTSGDEMVRPIGELLGVTDVIATRMVVEDGHYTGDVEFYAAGPNKVIAVSELAKRRAYDLTRSYAYSDSVTDAPLLDPSATQQPSILTGDCAGLPWRTVGRRWNSVIPFH